MYQVLFLLPITFQSYNFQKVLSQRRTLCTPCIIKGNNDLLFAPSYPTTPTNSVDDFDLIKHFIPECVGIFPVYPLGFNFLITDEICNCFVRS